jgi:hypothetical protein
MIRAALIVGFYVLCECLVSMDSTVGMDMSARVSFV